MVPQRTWAHSSGVGVGTTERRDLCVHRVTHSQKETPQASVSSGAVTRRRMFCVFMWLPTKQQYPQSRDTTM